MKDINIFTKISRKSNELINEYIPNGFFSYSLYSQTIQTVYWMPKINPKLEWSNSLDFDFNIQVEFLKQQYSYSSNSSFGNFKFPNDKGIFAYVSPNQTNQNESSQNNNKFSSVTNAPSIILNITYLVGPFK